MRKQLYLSAYKQEIAISRTQAAANIIFNIHIDFYQHDTHRLLIIEVNIEDDFTTVIALYQINDIHQYEEQYQIMKRRGQRQP